MEIVSKHKLICYSKKYFLFSAGTRLYLADAKADSQCDISFEKLRPLGDLPIGSAKRFLGKFRLFARGLRLEPRCGIFVDDSTALVSYHGAIYRVDCDSCSIDSEHEFRPGMNNPLNFVKISGQKEFTDGIYYGEYFLNHGGERVRIFRRKPNGQWHTVYTFAPGQVYHIHGIIPDAASACVYILTGDKDAESGIFVTYDDFKTVTPIVTGRQAFRACVALPVEGGMLYTTDTPLEENYLYHLDFNTKEITPVMVIDGPSIYGRTISDYEFVFSTSVEPDSRIEGLKYEFTYKLGPGVKNKNSHLYYCLWDGNTAHCKEIFAATKDILPMGAGQFGTMMFPEGDVYDGLYVTCQALRKYDNKTIKFSLD